MIPIYVLIFVHHFSNAFLKYLNRSIVSCQQALEGGLPPPPGLNEIHRRSLQNLQFKVLKLTIDSPNMGLDHITLLLLLCLWVGTGFIIAFVMTGDSTRLRRLMRIAYRPFELLARHLRLNFWSSPTHAEDNTTIIYELDIAESSAESSGYYPRIIAASGLGQPLRPQDASGPVELGAVRGNYEGKSGIMRRRGERYTVARDPINIMGAHGAPMNTK